jgi:hypothetical protein
MTDHAESQRGRAIVVDIVRFLLEAQTLASIRAGVRVLAEAVTRSSGSSGEAGAAFHFATRLATMLELAHELEATGATFGVSTALRELEQAATGEHGAQCVICRCKIEPGDPALELAGLCADCGDTRIAFVEHLIGGLGAKDERQPWPTPLDLVSYAGELAAARVLPVLASGAIDPRGVK